MTGCCLFIQIFFDLNDYFILFVVKWAATGIYYAVSVGRAKNVSICFNSRCSQWVAYAPYDPLIKSQLKSKIQLKEKSKHSRVKVGNAAYKLKRAVKTRVFIFLKKIEFQVPEPTIRFDNKVKMQ